MNAFGFTRVSFVFQSFSFAHRKPCSVVIAAMVRFAFLAALVAACGSGSTSQPAAALTVQGKALMADGSAAAGLHFELNLLASGHDLFPAGVNGCTAGDADAQALQVISTTTDAEGSFAAQAVVAKFSRATDNTCFMDPAKIANFTQMDVRAQADATATTCEPYCQNQHQGNACVSDCVGSTQKFTSIAKLSFTSVSPKAGVEVVVDFNALGPAVNQTPTPMPDLLVNGDAIASSISLDQLLFADDACEIQEGCVAAAGNRTLLHFEGDIMNLGSDDLRLGTPGTSPYFSFSTCHQHYHLENIMSYELLDHAGNQVFGDTGAVVGRKQGFCIEGVERVSGSADNIYDCDNQGLAPGWMDVYGAGLSCQWLDVTGVPPGEYQLRVTVDPLHTFPESNYDNNTVTVAVPIQPIDKR
jgi:hypothetical protein